MSLPGNGIFVVKGEMSILLTAMRRGQNRWSSSHHHHQDDDHDPLVKAFQDLKEVLNRIDDLRLIDPIEFLGPFLEVIRSEDTTGPVTSLSLSAVNKFLSYGLIDPTHSSIPLTVHSIADAVTHARFVGTDHSSDGVVLMKILQVLKTLTLSPEGASLTNESLCDIMLSCFKICFETRLSDLLRRTAEHYLKDMIQLVFMRLPQFPEVFSANFKQLKMRPGTMGDHGRVRKKSGSKLSYKTTKPKTPVESKPEEMKLESEASSVNILDMQGSISNQNAALQCEVQQQKDEEEAVKNEAAEEKEEKEERVGEVSAEQQPQQQEDASQEEYINQRGIRFTQQHPDDLPALIPYGLGCVYELFRFLISLCNPLDKQNTDVMIHLGLTLLTTAFEVGADSIGKYTSLMSLVRDELCRNMFSLLGTERLSVFAADLQVCFLMFEALRTHLKFQLEFYLGKLVDIVLSDSPKITYEYKELALDNILNLWMIPGFTAELYLNYDCNMYCTNLYEDLTKLLAKNTFPAAAAGGVYNTHLISLDALLTVVESVEAHCVAEDKQEAAVVEETETELGRSIENIRDFIGKDSLSNRRKVNDNIPKREELSAIKDIKKWLPTGTEHFNHKPKKGIQFLQEHGVLKPQMDPVEVCAFLRENPALDKKMIGEFISGRNNLQVLEAFVKMFDFTETRIDEALRLYLETFRLPGEAPLISLILEHFAEHWHKCNGEPFLNADAAFTLAYAVIMLNVDQHNHNVKRQNNPMTAEEFKKNLKKVNGGNDFEQDMLDEIYNAIRNDEIVMPAEQTGLVRENYLWKVLLRRGASKDGNYVHVTSGAYDVDLFTIIWGPIVAALSFVFDKSEDSSAVCKKALQQGFTRCAAISSHFGMTDKLDILMATLSKYTLLHGVPKGNGTNVTVHLGANEKAQMALRTVFNLAHQYGSGIREGWKNLLDVVLSLYSLNLLPRAYTEAEDFIESSGKITLIYEHTQQLQKQDTSLLSSLYSYMVSSENISRIPSAEEQVYIDRANDSVGECGLEHVITDSKFLDEDALKHLIRALIDMSRGPDVEKAYTTYNENVSVFFLELLVKVVLQNRDRVMIVWQTVRDHLYTLVMNASHFDYQFLLERSVIGLLRLAIRLMRNEEMSPVVLQSMRMLLMLKGLTLHRISRQISFGLYELLKTSAQNIHTNTDWSIVFTLLECVGAGAQQPKPVVDESHTKSDGESSSPPPPGGATSESPNSPKDRGYTSDSEVNRRSQSPLLVPGTPQNGGGWILVGNEGDVQPVMGRTFPAHQYSLDLEIKLGPHDPIGLVKCCESLAFLVRDVAHITPYNFDDCVHCIRTFVEASLRENRVGRRIGFAAGGRDSRMRRKPPHRKLHHRSPASSPDSQERQSEDDDNPCTYHQVTIQLLDLMHTLHTRTAQIFRWWAEEGGEVAQQVSLWTQGWCPLLQGIARLCCDNRKQIRMSAITYLQRALLVHDLQTLTGLEWEACFNRVLFPLLDQLLRPSNANEPTTSLEETRMRAATVLSKVFLHHLTPLLSLATFPQLWLTILDYMDKYMHADKSDLLAEAIPESLKNMLLVMESADVFEGAPASQLWTLTWDRMATFLPNMKEELFREKEEASKNKQQQQESMQQQQQQPPQEAAQQPVNTSPLFAHLGQMVSTPIGPPSQEAETSPNHHTFPILYTPQMEPPVSLYSEYMGNPYNLPTLDNSMPTFQAPLRDNETDLQNDGRGVDGGDPRVQADLVDSNCNPTTVTTTTTTSMLITQQQQQEQPPPPTSTSSASSANLFQSGNYFCGEQTQVPGAEILFGSNNIPILTTESNMNLKYM